MQIRAMVNPVALEGETMTRLEKHIESIAKDCKETTYPFWINNGNYYISDMMSRILRITDQNIIDATINNYTLTANSNIFSFYEKLLDKEDFKMVELPCEKDLKQMISDIKKGRRKVRVYYMDQQGKFTVNAIWLLEAMKALNSSTVYVANSIKYPIVIFEDDNNFQGNMEMIMQINCADVNKRGKCFIPE